MSGRLLRCMSLLLALSGPRAISGVSPHCMPERTSADAPGLQVRALTRPRRAAQRLRRLAEGADADEGAAHPLGIAKAGGLCDAFDRLAGGLHPIPRHLDPQTLDRLRRRSAGLRNEGTGEMPRTEGGWVPFLTRSPFAKC